MNGIIPLAFKIYMAGWISACLAAAIVIYLRRSSIALFDRAYWLMLFQSWKIATFLIAWGTFTAAAPYMGDPTWDYVDASFMSILAYTTAPWVVAILFQTFRQRQNWGILYAAVCVWMFSASWSYDGYLVLRDGEYPFTWLPNLFASSVLYLSAGLFWSLEWRDGRGVHFGFTESTWPHQPKAAGFTKIMWYALPFMALAAAVFIPFLI